MRTRSRISGNSIEHVCEDMGQVQADVEQVISVHRAELDGSEVETHLPGLLKHSKELKNVMPLTALSVGEEGEIVELRGGRGMLQRLTDMGFTLSTKVKVLASCPSGPVLIGVRDARIALGRGVAIRIMVRR